MNLDKSLHAFDDAKNVIPGGVDSPVRAFKSVGGTPPFIASGHAATMTDIDGNTYVDFVQSWGPLIFGHNDPTTAQAVIEAINRGLSFGAPTVAETQLAKKVIDIYGSKAIEKIRFVSSGTEAVMSAIRVARGYTQRDDIIKFTGCYHGHSDALLVKAGSGATTFGHPSSPGVPADLVKHTLLAQYNNIESVQACFAQSQGVACVIIEPIAGNMGLVPAQKEFISQLREECTKHGALLIFDEVMSGFRASLQGSRPYFDIEPDMVTFGKVIGGGMPVGAFGASHQIMGILSPDGPVYQAGTLSGNPIAMAAGMAMLSKLEATPTLYTKLEALAKRLTQGLLTAAHEASIPLQVDVRGSMFGFFFHPSPVHNFEEALGSDTQKFALFHQKMLERGFYFACSQFEAGFICDAMTDEIIDATIAAAREVFKEIA